MSAQFTPGPWSVRKMGGNIIGVRADEKAVSYTPACYGKAGSEANMANAHLIAAAPEMYAELVGARDMLAAFGQATAVEGIDAALAKARGE